MPEPAAAEPWISMEVLKLVVSFLTPLSVAAFGWLVSRSIKRFELMQWSNQKLIEKRLALYDAIAPKLNQLLCFYTWVGDWKNISPEGVLKTKRELDQYIHVYRHLFPQNVYDSYQALMETLFRTRRGAGEDAKIRALIQGPDGDRSRHCNYIWQPSWNDRFTPASDSAPYPEVEQKYYAVMDALRGSLGVKQ